MLHMGMHSRCLPRASLPDALNSQGFGVTSLEFYTMSLMQHGMSSCLSMCALALVPAYDVGP